MNSIKSSIVLLLGLTAVARAEPSMEADLAIKADLVKAEAALAQHNLSVVVDTLDDTVKYLPNADEKTLQKLIAFQDRVRDTLTATATQPNVSSSPALPVSAPPSPDQAAASDQSLSGSFTEQPAAAPTPPAAREHKPEPKITLRSPRARAQQPPRLALGARPSVVRAMAAAPGAGPVPDVQTAPTPPVRIEHSLKLLGYYAQDEDGKWVWLPAGSGDGPPR
jgi:hypothetical protein